MNQLSRAAAADLASRPRITARGVLIALGIYELYSLLYTIMIVQQNPQWVPFWPTFAGMSLGTLLEGVLSLGPWYVVFRKMDQSRWPLKLLAHAVLGLIFSVTWYEIYSWLFLQVWGPQVYAFAQIGQNRVWLINGAFTFYVIQFSILHVIHSLQKLREREQQTARLQELAREREIAALKAQINPHFLFNTLNTISAMVKNKPEVARNMIAQLAELMRYTLQSFQRDFVKLDEELTFIRNYLTLEHRRFSDRMTFDIHVEVDVEDARVPPMILQPLIENAIRHGIAPKEEGGRIHIDVRNQDGRLRFCIRDTGIGMNGADSEPQGVGLKNTNERLLRLFGVEAQLQIQSYPGKGTEVQFTIPLQRN
ncbi:MAG: histidine kinase [candidate division KSB1 bacterium]|nr:histidine kinase [candidate division KSB1 bacterium]